MNVRLEVASEAIGCKRGWKPLGKGAKIKRYKKVVPGPLRGRGSAKMIRWTTSLLGSWDHYFYFCTLTLSKLTIKGRFNSVSWQYKTSTLHVHTCMKSLMADQIMFEFEVFSTYFTRMILFRLMSEFVPIQSSPLPKSFSTEITHVRLFTTMD